MKKVPIVQIKTPFNEVGIPISDLTPRERGALATLMGISGARKEAFQVLREMRLFRKISKHEVMDQCPHGHKFDVSFKVIQKTYNRENFDQDHFRKLQLPSDAEFSEAIHRGQGYCTRCSKIHSVERNTLKVTLTVEGLPLSQVYEVN